MTNRITMLLSTLLVAAAVPASAHCVLTDFTIHTVTYHDQAFDFSDRCSLLGLNCKLTGYLIAPKTGTNLPAVVLQHGHDTTASVDGWSCLAHDLVKDGHVVFVPLQRGVIDGTSAAVVGDDPTPLGTPAVHRGFTNGGTLLEDYVNREAGSSHPNSDDAAMFGLEYLHAEADTDVRDVLDSLLSIRRNGVRLVDPDRVVLGGHSYGGAMTVLEAAIDYKTAPAAFLDLSGAALSYGTSIWWTFFLSNAAFVATVPIYAHEIKQESLGQDNYDAADIVFDSAGGAAEGNKHIHFSGDLPAGCGATDRQCIHSHFVSDSDQVARWYPHVHDFLVSNGL